MGGRRRAGHRRHGRRRGARGGYAPPPAAPGNGAFIQFKPLIIVVLVAFLLDVIANASTSTLTIFLKDDPEKLLAVAGIVGTGACMCMMLLDMLIGLGYAWLYNKNQPVGIGEGAAGGAIGGAVTRVLAGLVNMVISLALLPIFYGGSGEQMAAGAAGGVIGGVVGICIWMFAGAALGAIGGVIGGAIFSRGR